MTFCFSFEILTQIRNKRISKEEGFHNNNNNQGGGMKLPYNNFPIWGVTVLPECKALKKINFMLPTCKMEFDHDIDTRKHQTVTNDCNYFSN